MGRGGLPAVVVGAVALNVTVTDELDPDVGGGGVHGVSVWGRVLMRRT